MQLSMFSSAEHLANRSRSPDSAADWATTVVTWPSNIFGWLNACGPGGWYGRTSPASCRRTADGTLVPFSGAWSNAGMGSPTECLTLNTCEWTDFGEPCRSDGGVCSLSDILATGDVPQRYYLSAKACSGILRRAAKRGKALPLLLQRALAAVADSERISTATAD